jgi:N-methylhydantoinase B
VHEPPAVNDAIATEFDAISLEVLWTRLISVVDEAAATLVRTSFSTVVREANDYACGLVDSRGNALAENTYAIPGFVGAMPMATKHFLRRFPLDRWQPGDSVITNDPWMGAGHLPDIVMATPIFRNGTVVAFATSIAHASDIGGRVWSSEGTEIFEEGLRIPITKLFEAGEPNRQLLEFITANVRVPEQVIGDLYAAKAAAETATANLLECMDDHGLDEVDGLNVALQQRAESWMRSRILALPDGCYRGSARLDDIAGLEQKLEIAVTVTIAGDGLDVDYSGTSSQVPVAVNCPYVNTFAHSTYALKCLLDPETPRNDGSYAPIRVRAPEGTLVNPVHPAPVAARQITLLYLNCAIFGALAPVVPDRVIAESGSPHLQMVYNGMDGRGKPFVTIPFDSAGMGARPTKDGLSATPFPANAGPLSIEVTENAVPLFFHRKQFRMDSGGPGRFRGGLGQEIVVEMLSDQPTVVSVIADRLTTPPAGRLGGLPGATARIDRVGGGPIKPKGRTSLRQGDRIHIMSAGGGGFGPPDQRDPASVRRDLELGLISADHAASFYPDQLEGSDEANR